jgi:hypothetical protein
MKNVAFAVAIVLGTAPGAWAQGTALSLVFHGEVVSCQGTEAADVTIGYTFSTTAASQTSVSRTLRDSEAAVVATSGYVIPAGQSVGGWIFAGNTKTHDGLVQYPLLPNGTYELEVCGTQPGSGGNPDKTVCEPKTIRIDCVEAQVNPCANTGAFGEVTGNTQIRANATAQLQFRGNFGEFAFVEITGDNFYRQALIPRNGNSCNYHANWKFTTQSGSDLYGNSGAGVYSIKVSGNSNDYTFAAVLTDPKGNK